MERAGNPQQAGGELDPGNRKMKSLDPLVSPGLQPEPRRLPPCGVQQFLAPYHCIPGAVQHPLSRLERMR
jgi:hypothetical protein